MTVPATAPDPIVSGAAILAASVAWIAASSVAADIFWPEFPGSTAFGSNPLAILDLEDARNMILIMYADAASYPEEDLVTLTDDLRFQLPTRYRLDGTGVFINVDPSVSEIQEPNDGSIASLGKEIITITMALEIGVDQGA